MQAALSQTLSRPQIQFAASWASLTVSFTPRKTMAYVADLSFWDGPNMMESHEANVEDPASFDLIPGQFALAPVQHVRTPVSFRAKAAVSVADSQRVTAHHGIL